MLLTQEEVNALPDGSKVMVDWGGGLGWSEYTVMNESGRSAWAMECDYPIREVGDSEKLTRVKMVQS